MTFGALLDGLLFDARTRVRGWTEEDHPREPAGSSEGGRFAGDGTDGGAGELVGPPAPPPRPPREMAFWLEAGHEMGLHFDRIGKVPGCPNCDKIALRQRVRQQRAERATRLHKAEQQHHGFFVALFLEPAAAQAIAVPGGEAPAALHVTLCYCDDVETLPPGAVADALARLSTVAAAAVPLTGRVNGAGVFEPSPGSDGKAVCFAIPDVPGLSTLREACAAACTAAGAPPRAEHGWAPHVTLAYVEPEAAHGLRVPSVPLRLGVLTVRAGERTWEIPLGGTQKGGMASGHHGHAGRIGRGSRPLAEQPLPAFFRRAMGKALALSRGAARAAAAASATASPVGESVTEGPVVTTAVRVATSPESLGDPGGSVEAVSEVTAPDLSVQKGGPGSGFFGHAGRPGSVGGSAPGSEVSSARAGRPLSHSERVERARWLGGGHGMGLHETHAVLGCPDCMRDVTLEKEKHDRLARMRARLAQIRAGRAAAIKQEDDLLERLLAGAERAWAPAVAKLLRAGGGDALARADKLWRGIVAKLPLEDAVAEAIRRGGARGLEAERLEAIGRTWVGSFVEPLVVRRLADALDAVLLEDDLEALTAVLERVPGLFAQAVQPMLRRLGAASELAAHARARKGGLGSGFHGHAGRPGEVGGSAPREGGASEAPAPREGASGSGARAELHAPAVPAITYRVTTAPDFIALRDQTARPGYLSPLKPEDIQGHALFVSEDRKVGFALDRDGDVQNLFNNGGPANAGRRALLEAIDQGGRTLDCYDGYLPQLYAQAGFVETGRMKFNRDYAPPGWNLARDGEPDVVFMAWRGWPDGTRGDTWQRLQRTAEWRPRERATRYYGADQWDRAKLDSRGAARPRGSSAGARVGVDAGTGGSAPRGSADDRRDSRRVAAAEDWDPEDHPRGKTTEGSNEGSFAPSGTAGTESSESSSASSGNAGTLRDAATAVPRGHTPHPGLLRDANRDGVTDHARVGVAGLDVPTVIPRLPNLTGAERAVESRFAEAYENDPDGVARAYLNQVLGSRSPTTFSTDDAKLLSPDYAASSDSRALYNVVVHQTANAIAKRAFELHLEETVKNLPESQRVVLVTAGGVGAGKGYALGNVEATRLLAREAGAVWDTAGEQASTELPWVLETTERLGIRAIFAHVEADPMVTFDRVITRAAQDGRMVDVGLFADSYALGERNFRAFWERNRDRAEFIFIDNRRTAPTRVGGLSSPVAPDRRSIYRRAYERVTALVRERRLPAAAARGALIGGRIWGLTAIGASL